MSPPPILLTVFGGGGAAEGYRRAGFRVIGVDIEDHSRAFARIGCEFHQMTWEMGLAAVRAPGGRRPCLPALPAVQPRVRLSAWPGREVSRPDRPGSRGGTGDRQTVRNRERARCSAH